jgi:hypothetical protein
MMLTFASRFQSASIVLGVALSAAGGCNSGGDNSADASNDSTSTSSGGSSGGNSSSSGGNSSGGGEGGSILKWYTTCGDPVCRVPSSDAGLTDDAGAPCPPIGTSCSVQGQQCGTHNSAVNCGAVEQCDSQDPTRRPGGCPISSRQFKQHIAYVDEAGLQGLHDETMRMHLATYNYKPPYADPGPKHLGFIIEDNPPESPAVDWTRDRVDLYGYLSMVVATMQVQEKEITQLRGELERAGQGVCEGPKP